MTPSSPRLSAALLAGIAWAALLTACASEQEPQPEPADGRVRRLELHPLEPRAEPARTRIVGTKKPGDGIADWSIEAAQHELGVLAHLDTRPTLWLEANSRASLTIPLPKDLPRFNQIALTVFGVGDKKDVFVLLRGRGWSVRTEPERFPGESVQVVLLELAHLRQQSSRPYELKIFFSGRIQRTGLISIDFLDKPIRDWLPDAAQGSDMVAIAQEERRAVGLASGRALECEFDARAGERLDFVYGQPKALRQPDVRARLSFRLETCDGGPALDPLEQEYELASSPSAPLRWHPVQVQLERFAGRELRAHFELRLEGEEEGVMALGQPLLSGPSRAPASVLLITSDTHRADYLGAAQGSAGLRTPFLDQLIAEGTYFTDCYSSTNITNPSHIALMTATSPRDTGIINNISPLAEGAPTLAEAFRDAGYLTYAVVSARHLAHDLSGLGQGFDRLSSVEDQRDAQAAGQQLGRWLGAAQGRPTFAWLHVFDAHVPYAPPEAYRHLYYPEDRDPFDPAVGPLPAVAQREWLEGVTDIEYPIALYKSEITYLDEQLRVFVEGSRFRDGLIALTADHGESLTSNEIYFEHKGLFPNTISVPLILRGPGVPVGKRIQVGVSQLNLGRTLLDLAGIEARGFPGRNLLAASEAGTEPRFALSSHGHDASIRLGSWFLVLHLETPNKQRYERPYSRHELHLFDLASDPECKTNLAEAEPRRSQQLRERLVEWLLEAQDEGWNQGTSVVSTKDAELLAGLGYADESGGERVSRWFDEDCACKFCRRYEQRD